jgi:pyruvate dehydrogenase (quinone)
MLGNAVLISIARYYKEWQDPRLIVLVLNNRDLNMVTWEQRVMSGIPKFPASQDLPDFPYAQHARMLELEGIEVAKADQIVPALERGLAAKRPCVLEFHTDPETPPLPPHISYEQAKNYLSALLRGDPNRRHMLQQSMKDLWSGKT